MKIKFLFLLISISLFNRHFIRFINPSLSDISLAVLIKVFDLCINLRIYINDPKSMPIPTITDTNSLFEFKQTLSRIFAAIHSEFILNGYSDIRMRRIDNDALDFIVNMEIPFVTKRWTLKFDQPLTRDETENMDSQNYETGEQRRTIHFVVYKVR